MDSTRRDELEIRLRRTLKEHQQEGLHLIGGTDQLITRLLNTLKSGKKDCRCRKKSAA